MAKPKKPCRRKNKSVATKRACKAVRTKARKHEARVKAGKKGARARWKGHTKTVRSPARRSSKKRGKRKAKKKSGGRRKRSSGKRKSGGHRKSAKRVEAGRKAARTRKREAMKREAEMTTYERPRRKKAKRRRKNPVAEAPKRRRSKKKGGRKGRKRSSGRRRSSRRGKKRGKRRGKKRSRARETRHHHHHGRRRNPIAGGMELLAGLLGVAGGYVVAGTADRFLATHDYANGQDSPAQGDIYNSEAIDLPIWSSWKRVAGAAVSIVVPMGLAGWVKSSFWKSLWQLATFGAVARTVGKAAEDGLAQVTLLSPTNPNLMMLRLYAPEIAAGFKLSNSQNAALPAAQMATFAGLPSRRGVGLNVGDTIPAGIGFDQYVGWTVARMNNDGSCPSGGVALGEGACALPPPAPPPAPPPVAPPPTSNVLPPAVTAQAPLPVPPQQAPPPFSSPGGPIPTSVPQGYQYNPIFACPPDCAEN